jgi:tRNA(Ile)-lysidine synthetase-like protein
LGWSLRTEVVSSAELPEPDARWCVFQEGRLVEFTAYIALDHLGQPLSVRARRPGDRFRPQGGPGQRKLQDLMVDAKVPRRLRERLPVLCDAAGRVVAVLPLRAGEDAVVASSTAKVLVIRGRLLSGETTAMLDRSPEPW